MPERRNVMKGPPMPYAVWQRTDEVKFNAAHATSSRPAAHMELQRAIQDTVTKINRMLPSPFTLYCAVVSDNSKPEGSVFIRMQISTTRGQNLRFKLFSMIPFFGRLFNGPKISSRIGAAE